MHGRREKNKGMKIVGRELKTEFITLVKEELKEFRQHVERVKTQYEEIRKLKEELPDGHSTGTDIWIFSDNYVCSHAEESQSPYYGKDAVTIHPVAIYYRDHTHEIKQKSLVFTSDDRQHNA